MMPPDSETRSNVMRSSSTFPARLGLFLLAGAGLTAGLITLAQARDPAAPYLGMSQAEVVACAGDPHSRFRSGTNAETMTYHYSGEGPVPAEPAKTGEKDKSKDKDKKSSIADLFGGKKGKKKDKDWTCSASLKFEDGKLVSVNFAHKDVRSPYEWQAEKDPEKQEELRKKELPTCTFSLPRCAR
jgi:hypothetical protein